MARHAEIHARNARVRSLVDADVAVDALQSIRKVNFVRESDRLGGFGAIVEEFLDRLGDCRVGGGENTRRGFLG